MFKTICTSLTESSFYHIHRLSAISYRLFPTIAVDLSIYRLSKARKGQFEDLECDGQGTGLLAFSAAGGTTSAQIKIEARQRETVR